MWMGAKTLSFCVATPQFVASYRVQLAVLVCVLSCFSSDISTATCPMRWHNLLCLCTNTRWGHNIVQSDHAGQHPDGAVHEGHSHALCPPRSQRHHPQDHGEQTVLRGKNPTKAFSVLHTATQVSELFSPCTYLWYKVKYIYTISVQSLCKPAMKKNIKRWHSVNMDEVSRLLVSLSCNEYFNTLCSPFEFIHSLRLMSSPCISYCVFLNFFCAALS